MIAGNNSPCLWLLAYQELITCLQKYHATFRSRHDLRNLDTQNFSAATRAIPNSLPKQPPHPPIRPKIAPESLDAAPARAGARFRNRKAPHASMWETRISIHRVRTKCSPVPHPRIFSPVPYPCDFFPSQGWDNRTQPNMPCRVPHPFRASCERGGKRRTPPRPLKTGPSPSLSHRSPQTRCPAMSAASQSSPETHPAQTAQSQCR